jgi:hypothetical protein
MERIRINSTEFWTKEANGNIQFNSNYNYLISDSTSTLTVGGTAAHPGLKIDGGTVSTVGLACQVGPFSYNIFIAAPQQLSFSFT